MMVYIGRDRFQDERDAIFPIMGKYYGEIEAQTQFLLPAAL